MEIFVTPPTTPLMFVPPVPSLIVRLCAALMF
jgi:hypothetical protein